MHSSRMRAARLLPVSPSMHCGGEGVCSVGGCVCSRGGAVSASGPGGCIPACNGADTPCGQTDTCENITFANFVWGGKKAYKLQ